MIKANSLEYSFKFLIAVSVMSTSAPVLAGDSLVDRWEKREIEGTFSSAKSSLALEWCIARQLPFPTIIHGEKITEIDSLWAQLGVRIEDKEEERIVTFVANPRINDSTAAIIQGCI